VWYRKRPRLDRGPESDDLTLKTEPFIPGLDLVDDETGISAVKDEDILDTGNYGVHRIQIRIRPDIR